MGLNVWVQYLPGDCGTFMSWFINQHEGFINNKVPFKINDPVPNEVIADWNQWNWDDNWDMEPNEFYYWWRQSALQKDAHVPILLTDRVAFKCYPEHNLVKQPEHTDEKYAAFVERSKAIHNLGVVQLVTQLKHRDLFVDRMDACFNTFPDGQDTAEEMYKWRYTELLDEKDRLNDYEIQWKHSVEQLPGVPHISIDMGELLFELNHLEYDKLIGWLGVRKNNYWETLIDFYRFQVFENYGRNHQNYDSETAPLGFI